MSSSDKFTNLNTTIFFRAAEFVCLLLINLCTVFTFSWYSKTNTVSNLVFNDCYFLEIWWFDLGWWQIITNSNIFANWRRFYSDRKNWYTAENVREKVCKSYQYTSETHHRRRCNLFGPGTKSSLLLCPCSGQKTQNNKCFHWLAFSL